MSNSPEIEAFWRDCVTAVPSLDETSQYTVKVFGHDPTMAELLLNLVSSGQKTGTFGLVWEFEDKGEPLPAVDDWVLVTDYHGQPGCVYQITEIEIVAFADIEARHVQCEGPQLRELEPWRQVHWPFWSKMLEGSEHTPDPSMLVVCLNFTCHYPPLSAAR
jgi:uncharacterized protein YhfF